MNTGLTLLEFDCRIPRRFTEDDFLFLQTYANMLAAAVDRFQLVMALQQAVQDKKRLVVRTAAPYQE